MKRSTIIKLLSGIILCFLLAIFVTPIYANTVDKFIIWKKADNKYLIYNDEMCNSVFQFAISSKSDSDIGTLSFTNSAKDSTDEDALNVAFIDETNYPTDDKEVYIWIKDDENNLKISAEKIDLTAALDDEIINFINTTTTVNKETDRIKVDTTQTQTTNTNVDGVDTTIITGKIVIDGHEKSSYYYELFSANDKTSNAGKLYELADKINNYSGNTYGKIKLAKEFYELYLAQMPKDSEWKKVEDNTILQPEDTISGDKFIAYIKEVKEDKKEIVDIKLLECKREESQGKNEKEETVEKEVTQVVKLPVTYDSVALIAIFAVILIAIIAITILKIKQNGRKAKHS